jgi:HTH-type transcriptional regulator / antitoxin HigA
MVMHDDSHEFRTPTQLIETLMRERGWTNRVLAIVLGVEENAVSRIVTGKRAVDAELALTLEDVFGVPAECFLGLQNTYDLAKARIAVCPNPERATRAQIFSGLPVGEMIKRGWIAASDVRDPKVPTELMRFFGVNQIQDIEILPHAAKKTQVNTDVSPAQLAWLYRVKKIASETLVARYSEDALKQAINKFSQLLSAAEEARKVPRILMEAGVRFVIVETLPSAKIDGACLWLDDRSPVIGITMRFDRIDNFWFVLRHECEHVLRGHGRSAIMLDTDLDGKNAGTGENIPEEERVANEAAANFCIPKSKLDAFIARKAPFFYEQDIRGFANTLRVHPGLVAGQLRHKTEQYNRFGNHLVKIRSIVMPNAIVDGWGNIAPTD